MRLLCQFSLKAHANISKIPSQEQATMGERSDRLLAWNFARNTVIAEDSIEFYTFEREETARRFSGFVFAINSAPLSKLRLL